MAMAPEQSGADWRGKAVLLAARERLVRAWRWVLAGLLASDWTFLRVAKWTASVLVALLAAALLWLYFLDWNTMRGPLARYASARLGRPVRIGGNLDVQPFSFTPRVSVSGVEVDNPDWAGSPHAAELPQLTFTFRLLPFLFGDTILPLVRFDRPNIVIVRQADGRTNWDFGGGHTGWNLPPIQRFLVREGHIRIDDRLRKLSFTGAVSSEENAGAGGAAFRLTGDGSLNGNRFAAELRGGPLINVDQSKPYHFTADVHSGATRVTADGAITHPFHLGQFAAATTFSGPNLSELYDLTGLAMPHTAAYSIKGTLTRDGSLYQFRDISGVVGASDLRGNLSVETAGAKPLVRGAMTSKILDFKDLGELFGGKSPGAIAQGRLLPDLPLHIDRLRQMDADVDYDATTIRSRDFPMRGVHAHIHLQNAVLLLKPLSFQFAYGRLSGLLQIDARKPVTATDVDARLSDMRVEQFVGGTPPPVEGLLEARAVLHGSGNSVRAVATTAAGQATFVVPRGKFREAFAELTGIDLLNGLGLLWSGDTRDTGLRCAVAHFDASGGVFRTQRLVFDTDPVRVEGHGSIDLNNETLNLVVQGKPKEFRIGRVRAPLLITGPLAHPHIGIRAQDAILQGGIAVALGALFPPAAILPFVDPGLAKDANCTAILTQAHAQGAPTHHARHR
ncbi:MAG TPA: AsmA family protein [Rhizomicrobium sp.]